MENNWKKWQEIWLILIYIGCLKIDPSLLLTRILRIRGRIILLELCVVAEDAFGVVPLPILARLQPPNIKILPNQLDELPALAECPLVHFVDADKRLVQCLIAHLIGLFKVLLDLIVEDRGIKGDGEARGVARIQLLR